MIQKEPMQFLRRLPIIYIEDVCLIDSFPIVMWLIMADSQYALTSVDTTILLQIVYSLCSCTKYFEFRDNVCKIEFTHESLEKEEQSSDLLSLHYRYLYGGLKGDMNMLKNAIVYYIANPHAIIRYTFERVLYFDIRERVEIMQEAIDFHPFPNMLSVLHKSTGIDKQTIKDCIWFSESAYNIRKQYTMDASVKYKERQEYHAICTHLSILRASLNGL